MRHRVTHDLLHLRDLVLGRSTLRGIRAHHVGAYRRMADVSGDVDRTAALAQQVQVLRKCLEAPVDAAFQHIERHAFDLREVAHRDVAIGFAARGDREAAVADHSRRHAQRGRGFQRLVPGDLRIEVRVAVDDAGHQRQAFCINDLRGWLAQVCANSGDAAVLHGKVLHGRVGAAAVEQQRVADQQVGHAVCLRRFSATGQRTAVPFRAAACRHRSRCRSPHRSRTGFGPS